MIISIHYHDLKSVEVFLFFCTKWTMKCLLFLVTWPIPFLARLGPIRLVLAQTHILICRMEVPANENKKVLKTVYIKSPLLPEHTIWVIYLYSKVVEVVVVIFIDNMESYILSSCAGDVHTSVIQCTNS